MYINMYIFEYEYLLFQMRKRGPLLSYHISHLQQCSSVQTTSKSKKKRKRKAMSMLTMLISNININTENGDGCLRPVATVNMRYEKRLNVIKALQCATKVSNRCTSAVIQQQSIHMPIAHLVLEMSSCVTSKSIRWNNNQVWR